MCRLSVLGGNQTSNQEQTISDHHLERQMSACWGCLNSYCRARKTANTQRRKRHRMPIKFDCLPFLSLRKFIRAKSSDGSGGLTVVRELSRHLRWNAIHRRAYQRRWSTPMAPISSDGTVVDASIDLAWRNWIAVVMSVQPKRTIEDSNLSMSGR